MSHSKLSSFSNTYARNSQTLRAGSWSAGERTSVNFSNASESDTSNVASWMFNVAPTSPTRLTFGIVIFPNVWLFQAIFKPSENMIVASTARYHERSGTSN